MAAQESDFGIGDKFQQETKYARDEAISPPHRQVKRPRLIKDYPDAPQIQLPTPGEGLKATLWETLGQRRSVRRFSDEALSRRELSNLLWAAQGVTGRSHDVMFRTAPSAGALYPIETYVSVQRLAQISNGLYHYVVGDHALERLTGKGLGAQLAAAALDQQMVERAALVFIWSAVFSRGKWKYAQRAYRYLYLDAGHIAQNVALAAVALGLGSCQIAALYDDEVNALLGIDGEEESVVYMTAIGRPA